MLLFERDELLRGDGGLPHVFLTLFVVFSTFGAFLWHSSKKSILLKDLSFKNPTQELVLGRSWVRFLAPKNRFREPPCTESGGIATEIFSRTATQEPVRARKTA